MLVAKLGRPLIYLLLQKATMLQQRALRGTNRQLALGLNHLGLNILAHLQKKDIFTSKDSEAPILFECFTHEEDERTARDLIDSIDSRTDSKTQLKKTIKKVLPKSVIDSLKSLRH